MNKNRLFLLFMFLVSSLSARVQPAELQLYSDLQARLQNDQAPTLVPEEAETAPEVDQEAAMLNARLAVIQERERLERTIAEDDARNRFSHVARQEPGVRLNFDNTEASDEEPSTVME